MTQLSEGKANASSQQTQGKITMLGKPTTSPGPGAKLKYQMFTKDTLFNREWYLTTKTLSSSCGILREPNTCNGDYIHQLHSRLDAFYFQTILPSTTYDPFSQLWLNYGLLHN